MIFLVRNKKLYPHKSRMNHISIADEKRRGSGSHCLNTGSILHKKYENGFAYKQSAGRSTCLYCGALDFDVHQRINRAPALLSIEDFNLSGNVMKKPIAAVSLSLLAAACLALPAVAQPTKPADKNAAAKQAQQAAPNTAEFDRHLAQMQENMDKMQAQMDKVRQTQDPQVRQRLLQEHWSTMQNTMAGMHGLNSAGGMGGQDMKGGGHMMGRGMMGWGHMGGYYSELTPEQQKQREYMTDQKLRMHQMMMEQMMQHQHWMQAPAAKQPKSK